MIPSILIIYLSILAAPTKIYALGDMNEGEKKSVPCTACHNKDGNSTTPEWPNLAGQHEHYLVRQLQEFRKGPKGLRNNAIMYPQAQNLSDQDIQDLASYFSHQTTKIGKTPSAFVQLGEKLYRGGNLDSGVPPCAACHGIDGLGNELANFPRLSGQHPEYIAGELKKYRSGERAGDMNAIMRDISKRMTDEEIEAVSNYVSGLYP